MAAEATHRGAGLMTDMDNTDGSVRRAAQPLCVKCGYDLSGLDPGGSCPECGAPVAGALRGDLLAAADPWWLSKVHRGLVLITIGCALFLIMIPTTLVLDEAYGDFLDQYPIVWDLLEIVGGPVAVAVFLAGVIWVTTTDPRLSLSEQPTGLRRLTRGAAVAALILVALKAVFNATGVTLTGALEVISLVKGVVAFVCLAFTPIGVTYYLARLAERIPDPTRARRMRVTARNAVIVFTLTIIYVVIAEETSLIDAAGRSWLGLALKLTGIVLMLGSLLLAIALMYDWSAFRRPIRQCLGEARSPAGSDECARP
ncbi:MAG: hypothetical protein ACYSXF_06195 [Planctomycetota bacterium]|jgi:hypothetical protein